MSAVWESKTKTACASQGAGGTPQLLLQSCFRLLAGIFKEQTFFPFIWPFKNQVCISFGGVVGEHMQYSEVPTAVVTIFNASLLNQL